MNEQGQTRVSSSVSLLNICLRLLFLPFKILAKLSKRALAICFVVSFVFNFASFGSEWLNDAVGSVASKVLGMDTVHSRQRAELRTLEARNDNLRSDLANADQRKRELRQTVHRQKQQLDALNSERFVNYRGSRKLTREAVADTTDRVAKRVVFAAKRNVATTFGEALPVAGVAVVVIATAWELADACMLMQDLNELNDAFNPGADTQGNEVCGLKAPTVSEIVSKVSNSPRAIWVSMSERYQELSSDEYREFEQESATWLSAFSGWFADEGDEQ